jgi:ABC-type multidrug transport system ATPase subunit
MLQGDEGSGKTTLLRMLAGLAPAQVGSAQLLGTDLHAHTAAYQAQVAWLEPNSTAFDNVVVAELLAAQQDRFAAWDSEACTDLCDALELTPHLHKPLYMLSAGSRRKVWNIAALASGAALTLLDMPFAALDGRAMRTLREVLADCAEHPRRAFVVADYEVPADVNANLVLNLDALSSN